MERMEVVSTGIELPSGLDDVPNIHLEVDETFTFAGSTRYTLIDQVAAEVFVFTDADAQGNITRQLNFIFEGTLSGSDFAYDYASDESQRVGAHTYIPDTYFFWEMDGAIAEEPDRDTAIIDRYLRSQGFAPPRDGLIQRFVRVATEDRRNEFIIVYMEDLGGLGYSQQELDAGGTANHLVPGIAESLRDRALESFEVVYEFTPESGEPAEPEQSIEAEEESPDPEGVFPRGPFIDLEEPDEPGR